MIQKNEGEDISCFYRRYTPRLTTTTGHDESGEYYQGFYKVNKGTSLLAFFGGICKLITCEDPDNKPGDGTEITYLEMEVSDADSFSKLMNGEPVEVRYS